MNNQEWVDWLLESRAKQAELGAVNQRNRLAASGRLPVGDFEPATPLEYSQPMRGNSGPTWGVDIPAGPTDFSQDASYYRQAPGFSPSIPSRTPEEIDAADSAFTAKHQLWRRQEDIRNRNEDLRLAAARRKDAGQGAEWDEYKRVMAKPYQRPLNSWAYGSGMQPTGDQDEYGMMEHAGNVVQQGLPPWLIPYLLMMIGQR